MNGGNLVFYFVRVLLKLVLSLSMSLRFWYKSRSLKILMWNYEYGDPSLSLYCSSCPSIEANRYLHSDISAHIQNNGGDAIS